MRVYNLKRYYKRRAEAIEKLGGKCNKCDSIIDLEIDHINPTEKSFNIAQLWSCSNKRFWKEIKKCQLLCKKHHSEKSILEVGKRIIKGTKIHGTISSYRYCKCNLCKEAKRKENQKYIPRRKELKRNENPILGRHTR